MNNNINNEDFFNIIKIKKNIYEKELKNVEISLEDYLRYNPSINNTTGTIYFRIFYNDENFGKQEIIYNKIKKQLILNNTNLVIEKKLIIEENHLDIAHILINQCKKEQITVEFYNINFKNYIFKVNDTHIINFNKCSGSFNIINRNKYNRK